MRALRLPAPASPGRLLVRSRAPRAPPRVRARRCRRSQTAGGAATGQDHWSAGDPHCRRLARGREWDLSGSQAIHPVPMPRSRTPAGPTNPHHGGLVDAAPAPFENRGSSVTTISRLTAGLWHLLSTLHERCCHHPCKTRFRLAGSPLPGGRRTLWIAMKGFRFYISSPFPGFILTRRRLVLDGSEHSRTMIESGGQTAARSQAARTKAFAAPWSAEKRRSISRHMAR